MIINKIIWISTISIESFLQNRRTWIFRQIIFGLAITKKMQEMPKKSRMFYLHRCKYLATLILLIMDLNVINVNMGRTFLLIFLIVISKYYTYGQNIIAQGEMPAVARSEKTLHVVFGRNDSILYTSSSDKAQTFSQPKLIYRLAGLAASHTRGPQIGVIKGGLIVTAATESGDIFSFKLDLSGNLVKKARVNDKDTVAKENLMALSSDGDNVFAVWLDLRNGRNEIYGSRSSDGGMTWSKNIRIYHSPDSTVCECCKPSVVVKGSDVYVMFRNWLAGNRDLYLISSHDGGRTFGTADKLGMGSWTLKGCPMDGGGIDVENNTVHTVWNREGNIYAVKPGEEEVKIGEGRSCTITSVDGKQVYAWVENKQVVYLDHNNKKHILGKGQLPVLKAIDNQSVICIWENGKIINQVVMKI